MVRWNVGTGHVKTQRRKASEYATHFVLEKVAIQS
jgi:hypothetical protein